MRVKFVSDVGVSRGVFEMVTLPRKGEFVWIESKWHVVLRVGHITGKTGEGDAPKAIVMTEPRRARYGDDPLVASEFHRVDTRD